MGADVIVVGAGAFGCNAAWHLRRRGLEVLVVEAVDRPATQATGAAAGFVAQFSSVHHSEWGEVEWGMQRYGIGFYSDLAGRCGRDIGFCPCGIAYIYHSSEGWERAQVAIEAARALETQLEALTVGRASEVVPEIRFERTAGTVFDPTAIRLRAGDAIAALAAEVALQGVRFEYGAAVEALLGAGEGRIRGVQTSRGDFVSSRVLLATGAWTRPLLAGVGVQLAAEPVVVARYTTRPLAGSRQQMPMLMFSDSEHRFWIRAERGGLLIGGADPKPLPDDRRVDVAVPPFVHQLPGDHAIRMRENVRKVEDILPALKEADIDEIKAGMPCYTDDRLFAASAVADVEGLYVLAACNGAGITHGPALGRHMAELITDGETELDGSRYDLARLSRG